MEGTSSELVGGDQNDQTVQPSAEEIRKEKRRQRDNRRKKREQREIEGTQRELEKMKADYAKLEKNHAYLRGKLEQLEHDVEQTRETRRRLEQIVEQQNIMINMLQIFTYFWWRGIRCRGKGYLSLKGGRMRTIVSSLAQLMVISSVILMAARG